LRGTGGEDKLAFLHMEGYLYLIEDYRTMQRHAKNRRWIAQHGRKKIGKKRDRLQKGCLGTPSAELTRNTGQKREVMPRKKGPSSATLGEKKKRSAKRGGGPAKQEKKGRVWENNKGCSYDKKKTTQEKGVASGDPKGKRGAQKDRRTSSAKKGVRDCHGSGVEKEKKKNRLWFPKTCRP